MRILDIGTKRYTRVVCIDEPGAGNACHKYRITLIDGDDCFTAVNFQNGPIKESGINGCHNEDLIAIVIDRLQGFQSGEYSCEENAIALTKLEDAMLSLKKRTSDRINRGVEGTNIK